MNDLIIIKTTAICLCVSILMFYTSALFWVFVEFFDLNRRIKDLAIKILAISVFCLVVSLGVWELVVRI